MRGEKSTRVVLEQQADDIFQATPCANAPSIIEVWILQEWCDWGTLEGRFLGQVWSPSKTPELVSVYSEIALAGAYLHSQGILLGGLRARKVLLKSSPCPKGYISKVCDLRLVRLSLQDEACQEDLRSAMSSQADVYDAAVLMCFLIHGEQLNLELPEDLPLCFQKVIRLSLAAELDQRPVFHQLANTLRMA
jgi:serine/threonine protein kinase